MARLIVDSRESTSGLIQLLTERGAEVVLEELECGDYILADGIAVERKTAEDFAGSIIDRRLFVQIALLKDAYERVYVLVEGDPFDTQSAISPEASRRKMTSYADFKFPRLINGARGFEPR